MQKTKNIRERKAVLIRQRNIDAFICRRGLQLEIEGTAKPLPQRESPRLVDAAAERGVNYQLHSAALVEETLGDDCFLRRDRSEHRPAGNDILDGLLRAGSIE